MMKFLFLLFFVLTGEISFAQSIEEKIVASLDSFTLMQPQEKAYIIMDKAFYFSGETIWFKAFSTLNNKPTVLSKILYAELINGEGILVDKKMLKLENGSAHNAFDTKTNYPSGEYTVRAYTLWMLNFPDFIFEKKILIKNTDDKKVSTKTSQKENNINIEFFPEGGNLINGVKSIVAIKTTDYGYPLLTKGRIVNEKNEVITTFDTVTDGIAKIELTPKINETYKAQLSGEEVKQTFQLPATLAQGIVLTVDNSNLNKTFASVSRSKINAAKYNNLIIVAQLNYELVYLGKLNLDEGLDAVAISKKNLPPGIMQITVLTQEGVPLAERIIFVANHQIDTTLITADIINYDRRKKNSFNINLADFKNIDAAVSVTDGRGYKGGQNILSYLLMSSDIKGRTAADKYFANKERQTLDNLDLVMLTNGWRRYKTEDLLAKKYATLNYPFERSLSITGKVLESNGKTPLKSGKINLIINGEDSTKIISQANTNSSSAFMVDKIDFKKEATVFYQGANLANKNALVDVKFNQSFFENLKKPVYWDNRNISSAKETADIVLEVFSARTPERYQSKTLETVTVKSKKSTAIDSLNKAYSSDLFSLSDQTIGITESAFGNIWQLLRRNIPGISIITSDTGTQVNFTRYQGADFFSENGPTGVQFFLNEIPVTTDVIESLYAEDIGLLKVYKGTAAIAIGATRGAIALYTVKGKSTRDWRQKGFDFIKKPGYSVDREFADINYTKMTPDESFIDSRPTLYWNPSLKQKGNTATIEFYNDDFCKKFKIVIEGIDENGKLLYAEKVIE